MCYSKYNEVVVHIKNNIQENVHISGDNRPVTSTVCDPGSFSDIKSVGFFIFRKSIFLTPWSHVPEAIVHITTSSSLHGGKLDSFWIIKFSSTKA